MLPIPNHNYVRKATNKHFKHIFIFEAVSAEFINITFVKQYFLYATRLRKFGSFEYLINNFVKKQFNNKLE